MKIGILITHPTQFDVPVFRLGNKCMEVIYTDGKRINEIYDPELKRSVTWEKNNLEGYNYEILPAAKPLRWLVSKLKKANYDLLITNGYFNRYYIVGLIAGKFFGKKNALRVDTVAYNNAGFVSKLYKRILYILLKILVDQFFVVSTLSKEFLLKQGVAPAKIAFYGYVSDNDFFSAGSQLAPAKKEAIKKQLGISLDKKIVLCISKHNEREAPFDTLEAFKKINSAFLHLLLVGDGPIHTEVKNKAKELGIEAVSFTGYIPFQQLPEYYSIADVFVHDSHNEPWGVSVQEAIACNVPVVASDKVGSSFDLIVEGENGYVAKAGDVADLVIKIESALNLNQQKLINTNNRILAQWNFKTSLANILSTVN